MRARQCFAPTIAIVGFFFTASGAIGQIERPQVTVDTGILAGSVDEAGGRVFRGIPYAAPPVGELRWKEPQPAPAWSGLRDATQYGDRCQQTRFPAYIPIGNRGMSENCLFLNVWSAPDAVRRPVIVWIHGGGFGYGFSNQAAYDGSTFVKKGLVYVNLNYRVGAFGFLAHPDLTQESPNKSSGNYGILDQVAALQWIKRNIAAFGGDPDNVTIFGESAGSISVNILTASPLARGLFNRAIGNSGAGLGTTLDTLPVRPLAWAEQRGVRFAGLLRARTAEELRGVPAAEIADLGEHGPGSMFNAGRYAPNIDGYLLPEAPADVYARGAQNNVQLIAGWNLREANIFMLGSGRGGCLPVWNGASTRETFLQQAHRSFGSDAGGFLRLYPHSNDNEARRSAEDIASDVIINWSAWKWADLQARSGKTKTYVYLFGKTPPKESHFKVATHAAEIPYAFDTLRAYKYSWDPMDIRLAHSMSTYYANFAKTGDPNGPGLPPWPVYDSSNPQRMVFDENGIATETLPLEKFHWLESHRSAGPWCPEVK